MYCTGNSIQGAVLFVGINSISTIQYCTFTSMLEDTLSWRNTEITLFGGRNKCTVEKYSLFTGRNYSQYREITLFGKK